MMQGKENTAISCRDEHKHGSTNAHSTRRGFVNMILTVKSETPVCSVLHNKLENYTVTPGFMIK